MVHVNAVNQNLMFCLYHLLWQLCKKVSGLNFSNSIFDKQCSDRIHYSTSNGTLTDLSQSYLYVKFKIIKADGHDLEADSNVAPVNNFLHSIFNSVDLYLNNKLISSHSGTYPYRPYI